jgi:hypothetical protein
MANRLGVLSLTVLLASGAHAQTPQSDYTKAGEKACKLRSKNKAGEEMPWSESACPGRGGYVLRIFDGDLRQTVAVGRTVAAAADEKAAEQTFGPFNSAGDTVEWRSRGGKPFAIIQRWRLQDIAGKPDAKGNLPDVQLLVVTRTPPGPVCHVAYIDVRANPDANALARQVADEKAAAFDCKNDRIIMFGRPGRASELARPAEP